MSSPFTGGMKVSGENGAEESQLNNSLRPSYAQTVVPSVVESTLNMRPSTPQAPDPQSRSRLMNLPQEIRNLIWAAYYKVNNQAYLQYQTGRTNNTTIERKSLDNKALRLVCQKINTETESFRLTSPWTLNIGNGCIGAIAMVQNFEPAKLITYLSTVETLCVKGDYQFPYSRVDWVTAMKLLPMLHRIELSIRQYFSKPYDAEFDDWIHDIGQADAEQNKKAFQRGDRDSALARGAYRMDLVWLAKLMDKKQRTKTWKGTRDFQIYFNAQQHPRCRYAGDLRLSVMFRVKTDGLEIVQRNREYVERKEIRVCDADIQDGYKHMMTARINTPEGMYAVREVLKFERDGDSQEDEVSQESV